MDARVAKGTLRLVVVTATEFAKEGRLGTGFDCLTRGLASSKAAAEGGEPWAAELMSDYMDAINDYTERFGVRME